MDKLDQEHSFRTPEILQSRIRRLSRAKVTQLNERLLIETAKFFHEEEFNPDCYLSSESRR